MHVRVDQARRDERAGEVDHLVAAKPVADAGDAPADDRHVGGADLAGEDVDDPPARKDEVGRFVAAGDGEKAGSRVG